ncbi:MAG: CBS domain-containing protein [Candidatus Nanohaloarchaeota archaeon QJJ-7]|nr:CBS domain-containing protein [Candidatus Nanohaloarchaeota archaeon QJJ-7]
MVSAREVRVEDILEEDPVTVNTGQSISRARTKMEENMLRALPVVDGEKFVGMLGYRDMMEKLSSDPSTTKIEPLIHAPPEVDADQNLVELSTLRINSGRKKFVCISENDRMDGIVGEEEIAYASKDMEEMSGLSVGDVMKEDLVKVEEDDSIDTARNRMLDNNISRLVVEDGDGNLSGVVSSLDTLRMMVPREEMEGGRKGGSGKEAGTVAAGDKKGEKGSLSDVPVKELMRTSEEIDAEFVEGEDVPLSRALEIIQENDVLEVVVVDGKDALGIVTLKDVVDFIASHEAVDSLMVQLTGPEVPEEKKAVHDKIENQVKGGLGRLLERPEELTVHMKKYEEEGTQHKYTVNFRLTSELGTLQVNAHGWDLLDVVDEGLGNLSKLVRKKKEKMRDESRKRKRESKYSRD